MQKRVRLNPQIFRKKMLLWGIGMWCICCGLTACSVKKYSMEKLRDIEFTVVDEADIPEELLKEIEAGKREAMKLSYGDEGYLYAVRGYGTQETTGYSISVEKCYETEDVICVETTLLGPEKGEEILEKSTYPYIVIKMEYLDKPVVFE